MTSVAGGGDDALVMDYTAPAEPFLPGEANNGMNGQPNHRFLTNRSETAVMQEQGWRPEGTVFCAAP